MNAYFNVEQLIFLQFMSSKEYIHIFIPKYL